ncbi:MAG: hypothetical protein WA734_02530 [Candidatus Acidiferrales bacterium]
MKKVLGGLGILALLALSVFAASSYAGNTPPKRVAVAPQYNVNKEVTLEGTVRSVVKKPTVGMALGTHLILSTSKGPVDAHIGDFVFKGSHPLAVAAGQSVKVTGAMTTIKNKQLFLVRSIDISGHVTPVRTERGFLIVPGVKGRIFQTAAEKGGQR